MGYAERDAVQRYSEMDKAIDTVCHAHRDPAYLDQTDRRLLRLVAEDCSRSYAELGRLLNLSPSAVHERVKRLKRERVILGTHARLDARRVGRALLAFVLVTTDGVASTRRLLAFSSHQDIEEIHAVAGDSAVMLKARTRDTEALEELLACIEAIEGVQGTRSYIVLSSYLERGPSPEL
jgi:Lrp/AsnC family transcriptional regulator, leucine-responsive regulatory protein